MGVEGWAVIAVQAALSITLLVGALYLLASGVAVPDWLTNLLMLTVGSWFAAGAVMRVRNHRNRMNQTSMHIRQRDDGSWERIDG